MKKNETGTIESIIKWAKQSSLDTVDCRFLQEQFLFLYPYLELTKGIFFDAYIEYVKNLPENLAIIDPGAWYIRYCKIPSCINTIIMEKKNIIRNMKDIYFDYVELKIWLENINKNIQEIKKNLDIYQKNMEYIKMNKKDYLENLEKAKEILFSRD